MPRRTRSQNLNQNQPSESQNQAHALDPHQRPVKEKMPEHTEIDLAQVASWQAQLEGMVEETNQVVHTIKELLERMVLPQVQQTPRSRPTTEEARVEQQGAKITMHGHASLNHRANSQQVSWSQAEFMQSATAGKWRCDEVGPSRPHNKMASGHTILPRVTTKSQERGITEDPIRPSRKVFDRLDRNRGEDMRTQLEARRTLATSRRRQEEAVVSLVNNEINELRARLEKLAPETPRPHSPHLPRHLVWRFNRLFYLSVLGCQQWQHMRERPTL